MGLLGELEMYRHTQSSSLQGQQEHAQPAKIVKTIIDSLCEKELKKITNNQTIHFGSSIIVVARKT